MGCSCLDATITLSKLIISLNGLNIITISTVHAVKLLNTPSIAVVTTIWITINGIQLCNAISKLTIIIAIIRSKSVLCLIILNDEPTITPKWRVTTDDTRIITISWIIASLICVATIIAIRIDIYLATIYLSTTCRRLLIRLLCPTMIGTVTTNLLLKDYSLN